MSTWLSDKSRQTALSLAILALVSGLVWFGLGALATRAERTGDAHPYLGFDESRRMLLSSVVARPERPRLVTIGSSEVVAGLDHEVLLEALPGYDGVQLGMSFVQLDDLLLTVRFLEENYGPAGVPDVLVVGLNPKTVAFSVEPGAIEPVVETVDEFSRFRVQHRPGSEEGSQLLAKTGWSALVSQLRFLLRGQQPRMQAGVVYAIESLFGAEDPRRSTDVWREMVYTEPITSWANLPVFWRHVRTSGPGLAFAQWMHRYVTPYDLHLLTRLTPEVFNQGLEDRPDFTWDASQERDGITAQLTALSDFADEQGSELIVVNLPEYSEGRAAYEHPEAYLALLSSVFGPRFLDLWDAVPDEMFTDPTHVTVDGAALASEATGAFIAERLATPEVPRR